LSWALGDPLYRRSPLKWERKEVKVEEVLKEFVKKGKRAFLSSDNLVIEGTHFVYRKPWKPHALKGKVHLEGEVPLWLLPLLFSDGLTVSQEGNTLLLQGDYVLRVPVAVGRPTPLPTGGESLSLPKKVATEMGRLASFCGETPPFSAVYWDGERAVATDRFVFAALTSSAESRRSTPSLLLPKEGALLLSKLASSWEGGDYLEARFGEGWLQVKVGADELTLFLVGGVFPEFDSVLGVPRGGVGIEVPLLKEALSLAQRVGDLASLTFGEEGTLLEVNGHFGEYRRRFPWKQPGVAFTAKLSPILLSDLLNLFRQQERAFVNVAGSLLYLWNEEGFFAATGTL
jgi:hypothetical protein